MIAGVIEIRELVEVAYYSVAAGITVAIVFSLTVLGAARSSEMRRERRSGASVGYTALAVVGGLLTAAIVIYGLILVTHKT
jgi:hypothetical protein